MDTRAKYIAGFFLVAFILIGILGLLSVVAIPHVNAMIAQEKAANRLAEYNAVLTAINEMLSQSPADAISPVGPTADMSQVMTMDKVPLVLSDYLEDVKFTTGCTYCFTADGTVVQMAPRE